MKDNTYSRRKFIGKNLYGFTFLLGGAAIFGCSSMRSLAEEKSPVPSDGSPEDIFSPVQDTTKSASAQEPKKNPCDDLTGVSPEEIEKRKKLAYVTKSPLPDNTCGNCALYLPPGEGKACGGCLLFKGPVRAEGYCAYWAPVSN